MKGRDRKAPPGNEVGVDSGATGAGLPAVGPGAKPTLEYAKPGAKGPGGKTELGYVLAEERGGTGPGDEANRDDDARSDSGGAPGIGSVVDGRGGGGGGGREPALESGANCDDPRAKEIDESVGLRSGADASPGRDPCVVGAGNGEAILVGAPLPTMGGGMVLPGLAIICSPVEVKADFSSS